MRIGEARLYNDDFPDKSVVFWDVLEIKNVQKIKISFINTKPLVRQGLRLGIDFGDGEIRVNKIVSKFIELWSDTAPSKVDLDVSSEYGKISVYNIWDAGRGMMSQADTSGMIVKFEEDKYTYYCSNFGLDSKFDDLIFSLELL